MFATKGANGGAPKIPALEQVLNGASFSVARLIDQVGNWLSVLPGPITDVIAGGVWLLRRSLFPVGADVGWWGTAACVTTGDCSERDLSGADLYGQNLAGVRLTNATLTKANLGAARMSYADLSEANLTGANLTDATFVYADLAGANLTDANLSMADLTSANIESIVANGVIWHDTTCPNGSKSSTGCGPALLPGSKGPDAALLSDWLRVDKETGEWFGDEPVLLTTNLTTTLGYPGSSRSNVLNLYPRPIANNVDAGETKDIPNSDGDNHISYWSETDAACLGCDPPQPGGDLVKGFVPLSLAGLLSGPGQAIPIPAFVTVTMALEGDLSASALVGELGTNLIQPKLDLIGKELEKTTIVMDSLDVDSLDKDQIAKQLKPVLDDAQKRITEAVDGGFGDVFNVVYQRIKDWGISLGDPDDPVGLGATVLIPVDADILGLIGSTGGPAAYGLGENYTVLVDADPDKPGRQDYYLRNAFWDVDIQLRVGLLVPPQKGSGPQRWTTAYKGDYLDNSWADWTVETATWVQA